MFYAVIYALVINGTYLLVVNPVQTLEQCRVVANIFTENKTEHFTDAKCVAIILDKED